jgi:hypothetical protein
MNIRSYYLGIGTALVVGCVMACSDSTSPSTTASFDAQASDDIAPSAGNDIASDYSFNGATNVSSTLSGTFSLSTPTGSPGRLASLSTPTGVRADWISSHCTFNSPLFVCRGITRTDTATIGGKLDTLSYHHYAITYELLDSMGVFQQAYSKDSTASIQFIVADTVESAFTFNGDTFADTVDHQHNTTLSDLKGDPDTLHIWNSYGSGTIHSVRVSQIAKTYQLSSMDTTAGLYIKQPRSINPYPLQGTIIRDYTVTRTRLASDTTTHMTTRRVVVTFNGTANVPMTIQGASGTTSYTLNLDTRKVAKQ